MRAAIIGCGPWGPSRGGATAISYAHAKAMVRCRGEIALVAAASRSEKNLADFTAEFPGVRGYTDYRRLLTEEKPDFVSICAFPPDRETMVRAALEAGAQTVWVEKPFAISLGAAGRMLLEAELRGARLFVNFQRRYGRPFKWIKEAVEQGRIGKLIGVQIHQPGLGLIDFGPHLIDAALHVMKEQGECEPTRVLAGIEWSDELYQGVPVEASLVGAVHFSNGVGMTIEAGLRPAKRSPILRLNGEAGFAELRLSPLDGEGGMARGLFRGDSEVSVYEGEENFHHGTVDGNLYIDRALRDILRAVRGKEACLLEARNVLLGLEILLGLFQSAKERKVLTWPLEAGDSPFRIGDS